ncbi:DUF4382 domain-containing protein [Carboxylicivirga marina]|uniref:DUF4382 domain-containing protein n=1 Tax=Carboxylicivirga marina TaxID=2800988 RepID=A0ABS1HGL6_9BACT|nr:DUF4382 domain-containing protein [Carboxylicivirga marina]MBK3516349.1 DUF4382 domain-containing protein [Carboxylicivirga marina]
MKLITGLLLCFLFVFVGCNDDDDDKMSSIEVRLTDSPAEYEKVLIDVEEVRINASSDDEGGWQTLSTEDGIYDLLEFTNGNDTLLAGEDLPVGQISQMRLILGDDNSLVKEGSTYPLETPSAQQSGLKFNINAELVEGVNYKIWIDFDAGRSIVEKGNGTYSLKPVIRTFTEATSGSIKGIINPVNVRSYIAAISAANDTIGTFNDTISGEFLLRGIEAGNYEVEIEPGSDYEEQEFEGVSVILGEVTDLGTITLMMQPQ